MGTNPFTDRYLADAANDAYRHDDCPPGGCPVEKSEARWRNNFLSTLPDVDDATIGKVLLHLGAGISDVMSQDAVLALPSLVPAYLKNLLQNTGADLINQATGSTACTQPSAAKDDNCTTANPTTGRYLTKARAARTPHANCNDCQAEKIETAWIAELQASLPNLDAATIGQVLLHAGTLSPKLTSDLKFLIFPETAGPYLHRTLRDLGADLLDPRDTTPKAGG